jgi:Arc/MetJ family transcription regulator
MLFVQTHAYNQTNDLGVFMRTTLKIEEDLLNKAKDLTGIHEKTHLVRLGLEALIARESSKRLARLGGTERKLGRIPRRRDTVGKNATR